MESPVRKTVRSEEEWRTLLAPEQFQVCRLKGTEAAFSGRYYDCTTPGVYRCSCCELPLFSSAHKFDSGTGWPSFFQPLDGTCIETRQDYSQGLIRTEVCCAGCDSHLGHVFAEAFQPSGLRYCINSVSLRLSAD